MKTAQPRHLRTAPIVVIAALLLALTPTLSHAQIREGELDPSFGSGGVSALGQVQVSASLSDVATYDAGPERGKLVATGPASLNASGSLQGNLLARFNANGSLDSSFGFGGAVAGQYATHPSAVAATPDGGVLVVAEGTIFRFTDIGARDDGGGQAGAGFGSCGCGYVPGLPSVTDIAVARQGPGAGDILYTANGTVTVGSVTHSVAYVGRLTSRGAPIWRRQVEMGPNPGAADDGGSDDADAIAEGPNGDLLVVGGHAAGFPALLGAVRLHSDGSIDAGFGTGGGGSFDLDATPDRILVPNSVAVDSTGRAVIGGGWNGPGLACSGFVARLTLGGALDGSFGTQGVKGVAGAPVHEVAVDLEGRVLAGGEVFCREFFGFVDLGAVRLQASDGALDPEFGVSGTAAATPDHDGQAFGSGIALTDAGLVVAGRVDGSTPALVRFFTAPEGGAGGGGVAGAVGDSALTGRRAAALKKCKHKHRRARAKCKKKANRLPA